MSIGVMCEVLAMDRRSGLWRDLAERQAGAVTREQLRLRGLGRHYVRTQLAAGRWQEASSTVLVTTTGPLSLEQRRWVGVLHADQPAALAGLTALEDAGLENWHRDQIAVLVPKSDDPVVLDGYRFVETRRDIGSMTLIRSTPPRLRVEPAALLFAGYERSERTACGLLAAVVQQRLTTVPRMRERAQGNAATSARPALPSPARRHRGWSALPRRDRRRQGMSPRRSPTPRQAGAAPRPSGTQTMARRRVDPPGRAEDRAGDRRRVPRRGVRVVARHGARAQRGARPHRRTPHQLVRDPAASSGRHAGPRRRRRPQNASSDWARCIAHSQSDEAGEVRRRACRSPPCCSARRPCA